MTLLIGFVDRLDSETERKVFGLKQLDGWMCPVRRMRGPAAKAVCNRSGEGLLVPGFDHIKFEMLVDTQRMFQP